MQANHSKKVSQLAQNYLVTFWCNWKYTHVAKVSALYFKIMLSLLATYPHINEDNLDGSLCQPKAALFQERSLMISLPEMLHSDFSSC